MSRYDTESLYDFLKSTPEKGLRQMLIDSEFSEVHVNLLLKVVRSCNAEEFGNMLENAQFPRVKMNPKESAIKENFWPACEKCLTDRGVLFPSGKASKKEAA